MLAMFIYGDIKLTVGQVPKYYVQNFNKNSSFLLLPLWFRGSGEKCNEAYFLLNGM